MILFIFYFKIRRLIIGKPESEMIPGISFFL